jgi:hypothetical protein
MSRKKKILITAGISIGWLYTVSVIIHANSFHDRFVGCGLFTRIAGGNDCKLTTVFEPFNTFNMMVIPLLTSVAIYFIYKLWARSGQGQSGSV